MFVYDTVGNQHSKQPIDAKECVDRLGWSYQPPVAELEKPKSTAKKPATKPDDTNTATG